VPVSEIIAHNTAIARRVGGPVSDEETSS
jgi:hypothetical protein